MDKYNIDGHKLMYHPKRVSDWLSGEKIYPIYIEISLTSACNHRCVFCAPNFFLNYKPVFLETSTIKKAIADMAVVGVKGIMFGGEGEPLLHKDFIEILKYTKELGIDCALTTNGAMLDAIKIKKIIPYLSWIKFSVDAGGDEDYVKLHRTHKDDYKIVLDNISYASWYKRLKKYDCTVGAQALLFKQNIKNLPKLAKILKYLKADYLSIKPFSNHEKRLGNQLDTPTNEEIEELERNIRQYETETYKIIVRKEAIKKLEEKRVYDKCYAQDFMAYIDTLGGVHSCINYIDNPEYSYGNIYSGSFMDIWKNKKEICPDLDKCRGICRLDRINAYLWELKNGKSHINFI